MSLPTTQDGRDSWTPQQRQDELARWQDRLTRPDAQEHVDALVWRAARRQLDELVRRDDLGREYVADLERQLADLERALSHARRRRAAVERSWPWRASRPLRAISRRFGGSPG